MRKSNKGLASLKRLREQALQDTAGDPAKAARNAQPEASARRRPEKAASNPPPDAPRLTAEDAVLFRRAMKPVIPIRDTGRVVLPPTPAGPKALLRQRRQWAAGRDTTPPPTVSDHFSPAGPDQDPTRFVQAGCGPDLLRDLKRGKWPILASLDLHGNTLAEARARLDQFLQSCLTHRIRCVQVVHGKGFGSKNGAPVLKEPVRRWLTQYESVLAYMECTEQNGGAGAVQVLLRAPAAERTPS